MKRLLAVLASVATGCQSSAPPAEDMRSASPSPEIRSCVDWFQALDREVSAAGVRDLEYSPVSGFPYLRADPFLAQARARASRSSVAFAALADRMLREDLESRRYEIENLPAAVVEQWSGMRFDESRSAALQRSVQCGHLLRDVELARPDMRAALLARMEVERPAPGRPACPAARGAGEGAIVRYAPPPAAVSRDEVKGWLLRGEVDPLGQPLVSQRELAAMAALYAPSLELAVASDADRFGALRWRRGAAHPQVDATEPSLYIGRSYARYEERGLLQLTYTVLFPENRITWRVTLSPDGEPLFYDWVGADGCTGLVLTPRARLRTAAPRSVQNVARIRDGERPLVGLASGRHDALAMRLVRGNDSLARYALRPYDELRSAPMLEGRQRGAAGRPALTDAQPLETRFVFDLPEALP
jgi:hypothetical protein